MDIQEQIAFEKFQAKDSNCDYEELKHRLDHFEKLSGHRYLPMSPRHEAWLVWGAAWKAKAQAVPEVITIGNELQSWVAVWSFSAKNDGEDYVVVDANLLAEKIEGLTGASQ
ncbi:hypothetical protein B9T23_01960 [Acinetobacter terrae]|uniref:hypothetical protein n=1 Tax=Acinetobacter terrae TaxID=2731247 RepID=UPI000A34B684|nr:hypothetical protein [Acinetobacter terrae]OTG78858.1 hypothetical protein B9T23_01960 [Acinetobacter terrae]